VPSLLLTDEGGGGGGGVRVERIGLGVAGAREQSIGQTLGVWTFAMPR